MITYKTLIKDLKYKKAKYWTRVINGILVLHQATVLEGRVVLLAKMEKDNWLIWIPQLLVEMLLKMFWSFKNILMGRMLIKDNPDEEVLNVKKEKALLLV
jgi:hypothetical protein